MQKWKTKLGFSFFLLYMLVMGIVIVVYVIIIIIIIYYYRFLKAKASSNWTNKHLHMMKSVVAQRRDWNFEFSTFHHSQSKKPRTPNSETENIKNLWIRFTVFLQTEQNKWPGPVSKCRVSCMLYFRICTFMCALGWCARKNVNTVRTSIYQQQITNEFGFCFFVSEGTRATYRTKAFVELRIIIICIRAYMFPFMVHSTCWHLLLLLLLLLRWSFLLNDYYYAQWNKHHLGFCQLLLAIPQGRFPCF